VNGKFVKPKPAREAAAYLSSYFLGGRGHKAKLTEAVLNRELPRLQLYVSRRLTAVTKTTTRNKRRQRHLYVCRDRCRPDPMWAADREVLIDVICLIFPVALRLEHGEALRAIVSGSAVGASP
jgi:hypothetical protein